MAGIGLVRAIPRTLTSTVRSESSSASNGAPAPDYHPKPPRLLSVSNPSWVVRTESNVRKEKIRKPEPPCVVCRGSGRVDCYDCSGKGRTNHMELAILPKGEWPKWCRSCGGTGLGYCGRCLGTGEYRYIMGFHFMKKETDQVQDHSRYQTRDRIGSKSFTELLLRDDQLDSAVEG